MADIQPSFVDEAIRRRKTTDPSEQEFSDDTTDDFKLPPHMFNVKNPEGLIDNPLRHLDSEELGALARKFAKAYKLPSLQDLFEKAAKVARDPLSYDSVRNISDEERDALAEEFDDSRTGLLKLKNNGFWGQPKQLKITIVTLCVAAVVQGWTQTGINGANLNWPAQLHLTPGNGCDPGTSKDAWIFALVNASTYLAASMVGCWLADPLSESFAGRRGPICLSAILILASVIGGAGTTTWQQLLACRVLLGIGMGCKASVVPVFAAEVAPAHIRGSLVMNWQLFDAFGIFLGFTANLILSQAGQTAWRWQMASSALPTIVLLTLVYVCPESPRFLMKKGQYTCDYRPAYESLKLLRDHAIVAAKDLFYIHCQMEVETRAYLRPKDLEMTSAMPQRRDSNDVEKWTQRPSSSLAKAPRRPGRASGYVRKLTQLFTVPRIRRALTAAIVCMISQQLCGINVLSFYSSTIFCDAQGFEQVNSGTDLTSLWLSWGFGIANFVFAFPAYLLIDSRGRRWLLLVALPFLALSMLATALSFKIPTHNPAHAPVIGVFSYIFIFFYSWSLGPVPFTLSAEVFPLENRMVGMSMAVSANLFGAGLLTFFVPALTYAIGHAGLLGIFAALNVLAFALVFFFVRETSGAAIRGEGGSMIAVSLEELNYIFDVSTAYHTTYQLTVNLPWTLKNIGKLLLFKEVEPPEKCFNTPAALKQREMVTAGRGATGREGTDMETQ